MNWFKRILVLMFDCRMVVVYADGPSLSVYDADAALFMIDNFKGTFTPERAQVVGGFLDGMIVE